MATSHEVFTEMKELMEEMKENAVKWEKGTKSAAAKVRKGTIALDKLGKLFRKLSVAETK
jgi:hypothetical protein